ncbi:hypothetical protein, partial [Vibrio parahaemolyticus]|uniref:hypothetical protein n=2 Tax=Vibrionaceae TaxID=641 RepID=UPI001C60E786
RALGFREIKMNKCWICSEKAISKEHVIKKSDLVRVFGKGPYKDDNSIAHVKNGKLKLIQGPDSKAIKYSPSLCHSCNTTLTQPFDRAYDKFINYVYENEEVIVRKRFIDLVEVFGDDFQEGQCNLYRYFAKSIGCRLVDAGAGVPLDIVNLLKVRPFQTGLRLNFAVHEDILLLPNNDRDGFIGKSDLNEWWDKIDPEIFNGYTWAEHVSWLYCNYWYLLEPDGSLGSTWVADSRFLYLGSCRSLTTDERNTLIKKVQDKKA